MRSYTHTCIFLNIIFQKLCWLALTIGSVIYVEIISMYSMRNKVSHIPDMDIQWFHQHLLMRSPFSLLFCHFLSNQLLMCLSLCGPLLFGLLVYSVGTPARAAVLLLLATPHGLWDPSSPDQSSAASSAKHEVSTTGLPRKSPSHLKARVL